MIDQNTTAALRIVIVDDDPFVRTSLATILTANDDIHVLDQGSNGNDAIDLYNTHRPDILLIDVQMPEKNGLDAARDIIAVHPDARIVFLTTFSDDEYIVAALRMGAKGYLIKQEVANIAPALRSVMMGQNVLGDEVLDRFDTLMQPQTPTPKEDGHAALRQQGLSDRELEILELVSEGLDNKEIATRAYMSEGTVRNHVSTILQKLGLKNRTQLAIHYYRSF